MIKQAKYLPGKTCLIALKAGLLFGFLSFVHTSFSQPGSDTVVKEAVEHAINTLPENQLGIYNGFDYTPTTLTAGGHPFLLTGELIPETILFDGIAYSKINLLYDAAQERVVIENYAGNRICPPVEKIEMFTLGVYKFKRFSKAYDLPDGFYDELVEGKLYAQRSKSVKGLQWKTTTAYYFINEGHSFHLTKKKSLLECMSDHENEIREYIAAHNLSFGKKIEKSLVEIVQFYSTLKH